MEMVLTASGVLATALITACVVPQAVSVVRERDVSGVSVTAAALATVSCVAWAAYAFAVGMTLPALSSTFGAVLWATIAATAGVRNHAFPSAWVVLWAATASVVGIVGGVTLLGVVLLAEALTNTVPQAVRARTTVQGVAAPTYLMMFGGASSWVVYAAIAGDLPLAASSALKASVSLYIVVRVAHARLSATSPAAAVPH